MLYPQHIRSRLDIEYINCNTKNNNYKKIKHTLTIRLQFYHVITSGSLSPTTNNRKFSLENPLNSLHQNQEHQGIFQNQSVLYSVTLLGMLHSNQSYIAQYRHKKMSSERNRTGCDKHCANMLFHVL